MTDAQSKTLEGTSSGELPLTQRDDNWPMMSTDESPLYVPLDETNAWLPNNMQSQLGLVFSRKHVS
jgi:hypothetical protein